MDAPWLQVYAMETAPNLQEAKLHGYLPNARRSRCIYPYGKSGDMTHLLNAYILGMSISWLPGLLPARKHDVIFLAS